MMVEHQGLESLQVWQKARELMRCVHERVVPALPPDEKWDLAAQIRRASKSIMANIAEGYGRYYYQETIRFCYIARGSLEETRSHLATALDLRYIQLDLFADAISVLDETHRMLNGYIAYLKRTRRGGDLPGGALSESPADYETTSSNECPNPQSPNPQSLPSNEVNDEDTTILA